MWRPPRNQIRLLTDSRYAQEERVEKGAPLGLAIQRLVAYQKLLEDSYAWRRRHRSASLQALGRETGNPSASRKKRGREPNRLLQGQGHDRWRDKSGRTRRKISYLRLHRQHFRKFSRLRCKSWTAMRRPHTLRQNRVRKAGASNNLRC